MRIAVAGATGNIGSLTVAALERNGHDVVRISRSLGVDLSTGAGLDNALAGVEALVDATNISAVDRADSVALFGTSSPRSRWESRWGVTSISPGRRRKTWWTWPGVPTRRAAAR